jgi:uncharacterized membrane protein YhiD involved in acid resistance
VRYRSKISDPKDAGVMLSTLAIGLASGVGLYLFAAFATVFVLATLWILESTEPEALKRFDLHVKAKDSASLRPKVEDLLRRSRIKHDLRTTTPDEICYEVMMPVRKGTEDFTSKLQALARDGAVEIEWDEKKDKPA